LINKGRLSPIHLIIISFAFFGLGYSFLNEPARFFKNILIFVSISAIIFGLIYFFVIRKRDQNDELKKYRKAVKQSKRRQKNQSSQAIGMKSRRGTSLAKKKRAHPPHLRVIDGKKSAKKNKLSL